MALILLQFNTDYSSFLPTELCYDIQLCNTKYLLFNYEFDFLIIDVHLM